MKLAMVVPNLGFVGGVERHAHDLARSLSARGHTMRLIHGPGRGRDPRDFCSPFSSVVALNDRRCVEGIDAAYVLSAGDVHEIAGLGVLPTAVCMHDHALTCPRSYRYLPISRSPCHRTPGFGCIAHGCCVVRDRRPDAFLPIALRNPFLLRQRLFALARRAMLIACSQYVADKAVASGVAAERVRVIHSIPPENAHPPVALPREPRLVAVGQLLRGKGFDIAIRALRHLPAGVTLELVGDGPSRGALERLARKVAPGRVHFTGYVPPDRTFEQYDRARVALVPSRWPEPFGMVGIEAMRRARAVVGAAHGGIPEWLEEGEGGALFEPGSVEGLARAVDRVLRDDDAGERARAYCTDRFPHSGLVDAVEDLLESIRCPASPDSVSGMGRRE
jgi:glycosyltransferase involved in cell wall biosynthesis